jgi:hypothetical protein
MIHWNEWKHSALSDKEQQKLDAIRLRMLMPEKSTMPREELAEDWIDLVRAYLK